MLHHIALRTNSPTTLAEFYVRVCGLAAFPHTPANASGPWLHAGATIVMIEPRDSGETRPTTATMDILAFRDKNTAVNDVLDFLLEQPNQAQV